MSEFLPLPKYHRVYLVLKERLTEGLYDELVPGELELMAEFDVSRVTIRKALGNLAADGLIVRSAGRGTRRLGGGAHTDGARRPGARLGLLDNLVKATQSTTVRVVAQERVAASESVASALQLPAGAEVMRIERVRSTKDGPVSFIVAFIPGDLAKSLGKRKLERVPVLTLLEEAGVEIGRATQNVSARQADAQVARYLDVPVGAALLAVSRVVFDTGERPVQWLQGLYRPDRYEYEMQLSRAGEVDAKVWISAEAAVN